MNGIPRLPGSGRAILAASLLSACAGQVDDQALTACPPAQIAVPSDRIGHSNEDGDLRFVATMAELTSSCRRDDDDIEVDIAFTMSAERGPAFDSVVRFMNEFREEPGQTAKRIYMNCGIYESLIYENRSLVPRLQQQGIEVSFEEARDAHNWENWRDRLRNGLTWLFPGPVWMVYE